MTLAHMTCIFLFLSFSLVHCKIVINSTNHMNCGESKCNITGMILSSVSINAFIIIIIITFSTTYPRSSKLLYFNLMALSMPILPYYIYMRELRYKYCEAFSLDFYLILTRNWIKVVQKLNNSVDNNSLTFSSILILDFLY